MRLPHIVVIDLVPDLCLTGDCPRLPLLLRRSMWADYLHYVTSIQSLNEIHVHADHVVLRPARTTVLPYTITMIKEKWANASLMGLFCSSWETQQVVLEAFHSGLDDYFSCPFRAIDVLPRIYRLRHRKERTPTSTSLQQTWEPRYEPLIGVSPCFLKVRARIQALAICDVAVLIVGESGAGKNLVARSIHNQSLRRHRTFSSISCKELSAPQLESRLFGFDKVFAEESSAKTESFLVETEGGTLFLRDIDALNEAAQKVLVRFLGEWGGSSAGSSLGRQRDVRIIAATGCNLGERVEAKLFRKDLYRQLGLFSLDIPALRDRREDIPVLAAHFANQYGCHAGGDRVRISAGAAQKLLTYPWPGNIRELEGVIHWAILRNSTPILRAQDIALHPID